MITTGINVDESVCDAVVVNLNWSGVDDFPTKLHVRLTSNHRGKFQNLDNIDLHRCMFRQRTHCPGHVEFARGPTSITDQIALSSSTSWSAWSPGTNATDLSVGVRVHTSYTRREVIHRLASTDGDSTPRVPAGEFICLF